MDKVLPEGTELYRFIVRRWGINLQEAEKISEHPSYGAFRIERSDRAMGVVYFDSKSKRAFEKANNAETIARVAELINKSTVAKKLAEISSELEQRADNRIRLFRAN